MVQFLDRNAGGGERLPSTAERFNQVFGNLAKTGGQIGNAMQERKAMEQALGPEAANLPADFQKLAYASKLKQKEQGEKLQQESEFEKRDYDVIKNSFGDKFANIWKASPIGGRTELIKKAIDATQRGINLEQMLDSINETTNESSIEGIHTKINPEKKVQLTNGEIPKDFKWPNFNKRPEGYLPKDWIDEKAQWRKENAPIFLETKNKLQTNKRDELGIKSLTNLNESRKLPEGFERLIINPETGDFYGMAQLAELPSPEAQQWVKEVARFQNRAKDAFGSRVTNFDLQSYMKQFPGLMNSYEGRRRILKMMDINNKLDSLYDTALKKVYEKYDLNGVSQVEANKLAESLIEDETKSLHDEYLELDDINSTMSSKLSGRLVDVVGPDGNEYEIDESEVGDLPEGFRLK